VTLGIFQLLLGSVAARTQQGYDWGMGPRSNLTQYFCRPGAFATNSPFRPAVVLRSAKPARNTSKKPTIKTATETSVDQVLPCSPLSW